MKRSSQEGNISLCRSRRISKSKSKDCDIAKQEADRLQKELQEIEDRANQKVNLVPNKNQYHNVKYISILSCNPSNYGIV